MYQIYILYSPSADRHYIGSAENHEERLAQHNAGRNKSTKHGIPWKIVYTEVFPTRAEAFRRELEINKKKSRNYIEWLICSARQSTDLACGKAAGSNPAFSTLKPPRQGLFLYVLSLHSLLCIF